MTVRNSIELLVLGAVWGASFIFMRIASPEVGPLAMTWLRIVVGGVAAGIATNVADFVMHGMIMSAT